MGAAAACPAVARASTITVQNANDSGAGSLRGAIASSASGDTIDFAPSLNGQTITLTSGELVLPHSLTITGLGSSHLTISGNQASRVFDISSGPVAISGLTITGGSFTGQGANVGGGGMYDNGGSLTLSGVTVTGNQASITSGNQSGGGGIFVGFGASALTITNSTIANNTVSLASSGERVGGGGIFSEGTATTVITGSTVSGNTETQTTTGSLSSNDGGGGIYEYGAGSPNSVGLTLTNTTVESNSVTIDTSTGSNGGGGVYSEGGGPLAVAGSTIGGNTFKISSDAGGGDGGAGFYNDGGPMTLDTSTVAGNSATVTSNGGGSGGIGIYNGGGNLSVTRSTIALNSGTVTGTGGFNGGGAVYDNGNQTAYLNSTLYNNSLTLSGGSTSNGGGAIFAYQGSSTSTMTLNDTTIDANGINAPAGAVFEQLGSVTLRNTILADNSASSGGNCGTGTGSGPATITSDGFNIDSANTCGLNQGTDHPSTEPRLGPIQDNGGPTLTQALPSNSPAVDAGSCTDTSGNPVSTDQRGIARPQPAGGKCDIGAYELVPTSPPSPTPGPSPSPGPGPQPPAAQPAAPAIKSSTGATLSGTVNPENQATTVFFQYGLDPRQRPPGSSTALYDQSTPPQSLPADSADHPVTATLTGLVPHALYHVRLVATNSAGTTFGPDQTFTTRADPPPPLPVLGESADAKPVSGLVFIKLPGTAAGDPRPEARAIGHQAISKGIGFVPLTEARQLPSGTQIDARLGSLQLTAAAASKRGKLQTGIFGGGLFGFAQDRRGITKGLTTLSLLEGTFAGAPTYTSCKSAHASDRPAHAAVSSKVLQTLRASAHGKFRTRGRYAAATVRGTVWAMSDRCDGTLTTVKRDTVTVQDFVRHITVLVHAGQSYLAKARSNQRRR